MIAKTTCPIVSASGKVGYCNKGECELFNVPTQMCSFSRLHQIGETLEEVSEQLEKLVSKN